MRRGSTNGGANCGCLVLLLAFNLLLGGWSVNTVTNTIGGVDAPFWVDMLAGLFLGQFTVPLAILCWLLTACGVPAPWFHAAG